MSVDLAKCFHSAFGSNLTCCTDWLACLLFVQKRT